MTSKTYHYLSVADEFVGDESDDGEESEIVPSPSSNADLIRSTSTAQNNLGALFHEQNDFERAMECYRESLQVQIQAERITRGEEAQTVHDEHLTRRLKEVRQQEALLKERQPTTRSSIQPKSQEMAFMMGMNHVAAPIRVDNEHNDAHSRAFSSTTMFNISLIHLAMGNIEAAMHLLHLGIDTMGESSVYPDLAASLYNNLGYIFYQGGKYEEAADNFQDALESASTQMPSQPPRPETLHFIATIMMNLSRAQDACDCHEDALLTCSEAETLLLQTEPSVAGSCSFDMSALLYVKASIYHHMGDHPEARKLYHQFLNGSQEKLGPHHPRVAAALHGIGMLCLKFGDPQDAMQPLLTALDVRRRVFGEVHSEVAESLFALGCTLQARREFGDSLEMFKKALTTQHTLFGQDHPSSLRTACSLAQVHQVRGELHEALGICQDILRVSRNRSGPNHQLESFVLRIMGTIFRDMGRAHEANIVFLEAFKIHQDANQLETEGRRPEDIFWFRKENHDAAAA